MKPVKKKWLEKKILLTEREIYTWEQKFISAEVNLRKQKEKLWELMSELEKVELSE
jgi:hypothetical protein